MNYLTNNATLHSAQLANCAQPWVSSGRWWVINIGSAVAVPGPGQHRWRSVRTVILCSATTTVILPQLDTFS